MYNHGSTLNSVAGDIHYHHHTHGRKWSYQRGIQCHAEESTAWNATSDNNTPSSSPHNPHNSHPELPSQLYSRILMREGRGYPLMDASLPHELPSQYQSNGVMIGDVGIVTEDGYFDVLFNICEPADGAINGGMVPAGFSHLERPTENRHNYRRGSSYEPGSCAVSEPVEASGPSS